jgi:uncharacterized protein (TIGR03066 family)
MRIVVAMALLVLTVTFGGAVSAGRKTPTNKEKIIGAWKLTKTTAVNFEEPVFTFTADGKFTVDIQNAFEIAKGNYEVDGDTLKITPTVVMGDPKVEKATVTVKIKSLSDKEIVVEAKWPDKLETGHFAKLAIPAGATETAKKDKERLQGKWEYVGTEIDGKLGKEKDSWGIIEFKGEILIVGVGGMKEETKFLLNATRKLKAIQIYSDKDLNLSAYELDGDRLRICRTGVGHFPEEFKTKGSKGNRIDEFKRARKGQ